jgi:hypothetical protein
MFEQALARDPACPQALYGYAVYLQAAGHVDKAIDLYAAAPCARVVCVHVCAVADAGTGSLCPHWCRMLRHVTHHPAEHFHVRLAALYAAHGQADRATAHFETALAYGMLLPPRAWKVAYPPPLPLTHVVVEGLG